MEIQSLEKSIGTFAAQAAAATSAPAAPLRLRWWQHPAIIRHINARVLGKPVSGASQGLIERARQMLGGRGMGKGVSVGAGAGQREMHLIRQKIVSFFDLYETSEQRIESGRAEAARGGLAEVLRFVQGDALQLATTPAVYDLVHWNSALHRMPDVEAAVAWSHRVLKPGGLFYLDGYVGPSRFQWTDKMLSVATAVRESLPPSLLADPRSPGKRLPTTVARPNPETLRNSDPSEAADSSNILEAVQKWFPDAEITLTGGVIYHLALSEVLGNFDDTRDAALLKMLLLIDDLCSDLGETHYAVALAFKK